MFGFAGKKRTIFAFFRESRFRKEAEPVNENGLASISKKGGNKKRLRGSVPATGWSGGGRGGGRHEPVSICRHVCRQGEGGEGFYEALETIAAVSALPSTTCKTIDNALVTLLPAGTTSLPVITRLLRARRTSRGGGVGSGRSGERALVRGLWVVISEVWGGIFGDFEVGLSFFYFYNFLFWSGSFWVFRAGSELIDAAVFHAILGPCKKIWLIFSYCVMIYDKK